MPSYKEKCRELEKFFEDYAQHDVMVAFSGGVDSSLLLKMACQHAGRYGTKVYAVTLQTMLHPAAELENAAKVAGEAGAEHLVLQIDELNNAGILDNPVDRCYRCKRHLFEEIRKKAEELQTVTILEGTNADDLKVYRPGIRAVRELGIVSPLAEVGMTKDEVRRLAAEYGISSADRPSTPCLATRFPYGAQISYEKLRIVEAAEAYIRELGFYNVRVRVHGDIARIEIDLPELGKLLEKRAEVTAYLKKLGYRYVTVDMEGFRSGSMDTTYRNIAYYASWAVYSGRYFIRDIDVSKLTHLNVAFAVPTADGSITMDEKCIDTGIKEEYPHLKMLISIGGWVDSVHFSDIASDEAKTANMAASAAAFVGKYGFDGVDIDWEFPVEGGNEGMKHRPEDKQNYTKLLKALREALDVQAAKDGKTYYLTIAGGPNPSFAKNTELGEMMKYLDWVNVMTYDYHAGADEKTNFNAPLYLDRADDTGSTYCIDDTINAYIKGGAVPEKLNLGLAFYGRGHVNVEARGRDSLYRKGDLAAEAGLDKGTLEASSWDYWDIKENYLNQRGYVRYWNEEAMVPYLYSAETKTFISYDDEESIRAKLQYVKEKGLGGAMFWEASADRDGELLAVTAECLGIDNKKK